MADETSDSPLSGSSTMESVAPPNLTQANLPAYGEAGTPAAPSTVVSSPPAANQASSPTPAGAPKSGNLWQQVLQGALWGLAGAAGQKHFGGGLSAGAGGVVEGQEQQLINHFVSAQAAASIAKASRDAQTANLVNESTQLAIDKQRTDANHIAEDRGEPDPYPIKGTTEAEMSSSGMAALNAVKANNGGLIPQMTMVQSPHGVGDNPDQHEADAYTVTLQDVRNIPSKVLPSLNRSRVMAGLPVFQSMQDALAYGNTQTPGKGAVWVASAANQSYADTHGLPALSKDPAENQTAMDTLDAKIGRIQKTGLDASGNLDPNAKDVITLLTDQKNILAAHNDNLKQSITSSYTAQHPENQAPTPQARADAKSTIASYGSDPELKGLSKEVDGAVSVADLQKIQARADDLNKTRTLAGAQRSFAEGQKDVARQTEIAKQLIPVWTKDGFSDTLTQANQIKQAAAQSKDGNGLMTSLLPTMEVLGVNMSGKVRRISPTEYDAAKTNPDIVARWNQTYDAAKSGASTDKIVGQANQLADLLVNQAHDKAVRNAGVIANQFGQPHNQVAALDHHGNPTTLDKVEAPRGATGKAPDPKTGKFYWHDASGKAIAPAL